MGPVPKQQVRQTVRRSHWWMSLEVTHTLVGYSLGMASPQDADETWGFLSQREGTRGGWRELKRD